MAAICTVPSLPPLPLPTSSSEEASSTSLPPGSSSASSAATIPKLSPSLLASGPYNAAAVLPSKVAKRILDLDFVEMSEISLDDPPQPLPGQPPLPARPAIQDISVWIEKFSIMAALLSSRFPHKAPELFAYQASIIRAERNFDGRRWVAYDRCYRREALAQKSLDWSTPNARL